MKKRKTGALFLALFLTIGSVFAGTQDVSAKRLSSANEAKQKALQKVKNPDYSHVSKDYDDGKVVYEVDLVKGNKKYEITYRASDGKMLDYGWEKVYVDPNANHSLISKDKCQKAAEAKVKNGKVLSVNQKRDDGVDIYKIKMQKGNKSYTLKYHARTGGLIEYDWEIKASATNTGGSGKDYISVEKAEQIAKKEVPGGTIVKSKFDMDDGVPVYEVELVKGGLEYELTIHAKTGVILDKDIDD